MAQGYLEKIKTNILPRIPLEGEIDLTYRCNNNCLHCWLRLSPDAKEKKEELSFKEIKSIVDQAKALGCRSWSISGGEPMLRPDFFEIFDYITRHFVKYSLNTNGTLITPKIAKLLKRKGVKMVALYGATAKVHDQITRTPGSFAALMAGFAYLKEAKAGFIVQLIPMKDNYDQFQDMLKLAKSLSKHYRTGSPWLYLSACGDIQKNREIISQRLTPRQVVEIDKPDLSYDDWIQESAPTCERPKESGYFFTPCINSRQTFHIDPYGQMSFCSHIKDPGLRYDLKAGSFRDGWDNFIPGLARKVKVSKEFKQNCGSCKLRKDCRWCAVYAYLEHRRFGAKIEYLCDVAKENSNFREDFIKKNRRYFNIADITVQVDSDLPITKDTFQAKFKNFEVNTPGQDVIKIRHCFSLPDLKIKDLGREFYRKIPWAIYKRNDSWIYLGIQPPPQDKLLNRVLVFNSDHSRVVIHHDKNEAFLKGKLPSLSLLTTDQIILSRVLADRQGCYLHACGVNFQGKGLLFAGHSEAGKSTIAGLLKQKAKILCDDRMIIRQFPEGFKIFGTWSHGDVPIMSASSAPLTAIIFIEKAEENRLILLKDKKEITKKILSCLIRPFTTNDWWHKTITLIEHISGQVPCYVLRFDKSGRVVDELRKL